MALQGCKVSLCVEPRLPNMLSTCLFAWILKNVSVTGQKIADKVSTQKEQIKEIFSNVSSP